MATFYDTHAHFHGHDFRGDLPQAIERARAAGIARLVCVGIDLPSSENALRLSEQYEEVFAVVGVHPNHAAEAPLDVRPHLRQLAKHRKVVGIGETGLDYYRMPGGKAGDPAQQARFKQRQAELFQQQLEVAAETGLNCVVHQRGEVLDDTLACLQPCADRVRAVFHCFSESLPALQRILDLNGLVSFTGILTFKNSQNMREALAAVPSDRFMLETDCPYLAPAPYRGKRCEPAYLVETAAAAAQIRGCSLDELSEATCANARAFFRGLN